MFFSLIFQMFFLLQKGYKYEVQVISTETLFIIFYPESIFDHEEDTHWGIATFKAILTLYDFFQIMNRKKVKDHKVKHSC